jgi:hypothetical protein
MTDSALVLVREKPKQSVRRLVIRAATASQPLFSFDVGRSRPNVSACPTVAERYIQIWFRAHDAYCKNTDRMVRGDAQMISTSRMTLLFGIVLASLAGIAANSNAAEKVGSAIKINVTVTGGTGPLSTGDPVHRDERVRANASGVGQFQFDDGSKLAVGPNATVVIDKYVLGEGGKLKKLTVRATKGTFRFISGRSSPSAYTIVTPAGTMGIRG